MFFRFGIILVFRLSVFVLMAITMTVAGQSSAAKFHDDDEELSSKSIEKLVKDLDSAKFADRQRAMIALSKIGEHAIHPLVEHARDGSAELQNRALSVLHRMAALSDKSTCRKAIQGMRQLSKSDSRAVAARAIKALEQPVIQQRIMQYLKDKKIQLYSYPYPAYSSMVDVAGAAIGQDWKYDSDDFEELTSLLGLIAVTIDHPDVSDVDIAGIATSDSPIQRLAIRQTKITNKTVEQIAAMPELIRLELYYCNIDDHCVESLLECQGLITLKLIGTEITEAGAARLKNARPESFLDFRQGGYMGVRYVRESDECLLTGVEPDSAAAKAGLKQGDIIVGYNDAVIKKPEDLARIISSSSIKDDAKVVVQREEKKIEFTLSLGQWQIPELSEFINSTR